MFFFHLLMVSTVKDTGGAPLQNIFLWGIFFIYLYFFIFFHLEMWIFEKNEMALMGYSGAWGTLIHEKNPEVKNLVTLSLLL